ncbi:CBASS cGAMP-activated phospholipase [Alteromonas sp. R78001]|uniref:CBASS cGAMP-activated phospholipase n=1 Tax=Alteromonas sp. R78001 TaxID=3093865 RepID=UPI00366B7C96
MTKPYRVLSIDGGGIRGLYSACVLHGLAQRVARTNCNATENNLDVGGAFDMLVGTSTGAILATALSAGKSLEEVIALYKFKAKDIFPSPVPTNTSKIALVSWMLRHMSRPSGSAEKLKEELVKVLGSETVAEMYNRRKIALCIPTIDAETQKAWVYKTPHDHKTQRLQRDNNYQLVDLCMSSSAAPIVFPVHKVEDPNSATHNYNWFVDGGLWANNPIMVALVEALTFAPDDSPIEIISISTCPPFKAPPLNSNDAHRGIKDWKAGLGMMEIGLDAQSSAYSYMAKALTDNLGDRVKYVRLSDPLVDENISHQLTLDNPSPSAIEALVKLASRAVDLNISEATTGEKSKSLIMDVFSNLNTITNKPTK